VGLNYEEQLMKLTTDELQKLYEMKKSELEMFGYLFDPETLRISVLPE